MFKIILKAPIFKILLKTPGPLAAARISANDPANLLKPIAWDQSDRPVAVSQTA